MFILIDKNISEFGIKRYIEVIREEYGIIGSIEYYPDYPIPELFNEIKVITRDAYFDKLTDSRGLENLQSIGWNAWFPKLTEATGLENLEEIGNFAFFDSLSDGERSRIPALNK